jgi:hypothetical protein
MRLAMADPTDTSAVLEMESLTHCEIDVSVLPLAAIEELVTKGYKQISTAVVQRPTGTTSFVTQKGKIGSAADIPESEVSVTAQIPLIALAGMPDDIDARFTALIHLLVAKGVITEAEADALRKTKPPG